MLSRNVRVKSKRREKMKPRINHRWPVYLLAILLSLSVLSLATEGQYFGRNKVQYQRFNFKILKTKHFDVYYYPQFEAMANHAARMAERWYSRLSRILNHELKGRQPLILYASSAHFQQTTAIPDLISEGTGGVTEAFKRRIILPVGSSLAETDHVIGHELVHAFQYDITSQGRPGGSAAAAAELRVPLWFIEGMAEYLSIGPVDSLTAMWMRDATQRKEIPSIKKLDNPYKYFPYRYGQALLAYITGRWGDETIARLMKGVGRVGDLESVITRVLGVNFETLSKEWLDSYKKSFDPLISQTEVPSQAAKAIFKGTEMNRYNVAPSLSPNGKDIIFLSTRDLFSIDLYHADPQTGKIKKKITETAVDPEFESIQFIRSAGSWDPDGKRFVFGAVSKGKPMLTIFDVDREKIVDEIEFPALDEVFNPTWSPDRRFIVFTALHRGQTDLFSFDLGSRALNQLTDDPFADLQPAWSPDGRSIAFITDRFGTDLSLLSYGDYEIALMEPESGKIIRLPTFNGAKNINPQWSPDGKSIYFVSDVSGKPDIYRVEVDSGKIFQITNLYTGVSGITELSPTLSVALRAGRLIYSAYDEGQFSIFSLDEQEALRGKPEVVRFEGKLLSVLPPRDQATGSLLGLLRNPLFGLPEQMEFPVSNYRPKLSLDYVAPPQVGVGVDRFGTYTGGGVALFWSDMLGYHSLGTLAQMSSRLKDATAILSYQNSQHRLNWGAAIGRIPYVVGSYSVSAGNFYGEPVYVEEDYLYWQINYQIQGFLAYPFNQVRRLEMRSGFQYIDFSQEIVTQLFSMYDGRQLVRDIQQLPAPDSIHFFYTSLALVYDSAMWGATGPIIGQSYLVEFTPAIGSLNYNTLLADYRRYFMPAKPFTLAFRLLHFGRYGKDAEDERLWPVYIGYESLVRGYDYYSFDYNEIYGPNSFDLNRLYGSKILVGNAELRFPLFNILRLGKGYYGVFPVDMVFFYDWGVAWENAAKPTFFNGTRKPVSSAGVGLRFNVFGYLILGLNAVKPFDRPNKDWVFQLSFFPGF